MVLLSTKTVKTIKPHRCMGCVKTIPPGTRVLREVVVDGNEIWTVYICEICQDIIAEHEIDEFSEGDIIRNYTHEYNARKAHHVKN